MDAWVQATSPSPALPSDLEQVALPSHGKGDGDIGLSGPRHSHRLRGHRGGGWGEGLRVSEPQEGGSWGQGGANRPWLCPILAMP